MGPCRPSSILGAPTDLAGKNIEIFASITGDNNPAHLDKEYAKSDIFHTVVAHGMWGGSLFSALLGTKLPGIGTIYLSQTLTFLKPVLIGDDVTVKVTVLEKRKEKHIVVFDCLCTNQHGDALIKGMAEVIAPTEKISRPEIELAELELHKKHSS